MKDELWEIFLFSPDHSPGNLLTTWVVWSPDLKRCPSLEVPPDSKSCLAMKSEDDWLLYLTSLYFFQGCVLIVEIIWERPLFLPRFVFQEPMVLKLREKFFSFSGDDCRFLICNFSFAFYHFSYLQSAYFEMMKEFCAVRFHTLVFCSVKDMDGRLWFR